MVGVLALARFVHEFEFAPGPDDFSIFQLYLSDLFLAEVASMVVERAFG